MKSNPLKMLRTRAENVLNERNFLKDHTRITEFDRIFHELQVYQVELEMQNEELVSASLEIEKQKERFSNLFESAPVGYIVINKDGLIIDINKTGLRLFNKDKFMMTGKPFTAFVSMPDISNFYFFLRNVTKSGTEQSCQLQLLTSEKKVFIALLHAVPVDTEARNQQIYVTLTDITEKQAAEKIVKKAKQRLDLALDASGTGICELNPDTGRFYLDSYSCHLFGFDTQNFEGPFNQLSARIHPNDRDWLEKSLRTSIIREQPLAVEFRVINKDESIKFIQARGRLIHELEEEHRSFLATFTDISEKKVWEQETQRLKEEQDKAMLEAALEAEENEKRRMSEALHDGVAQMLYAAKLNLDHLRSQAKDLPFENVASLIEQTINDVRNLSFELTPSVLLDFGLKETINEMTFRLASEHLSFKSKISIESRIPLSLQLNIYRITQELVNNCIKHAHCDLINIEINKKNDLVYIHVKDNGIGMNNDRDKKKPVGTGLSSIRNRIKLYDGKMSIKPNVPSGTRVSITLMYDQPPTT